MKTYLIKNGNVLTGKDSVFLPKTDVLITDGVIADIGLSDNFCLPDEYEVIDATEQLVCPAFYNLHVHLGESIFRGKCDGMNLWEYLDISHDTYDDAEWNRLEPDIHRLSGLITIMECMKNGVGYIVCNRGWEEVRDSQIGASCLFPVVNINKLKNYYDNVAFVQKIDAEYEPHVKTSIFLQSMYLCDEERLKLIRSIMETNRNYFLFVHIAETVKEQEYISEKFGCTPIEALNQFGLLTDRTFCVHSIYLSEHDRKLIQETNAKVVLCPISNLKLGDGYPDVEGLLKEGIKPIVATDGFATNNSAGLLEELKLIGLQSHGKITSKELFDMITVNPATYIAGNCKCGYIQRGYKTNISIFSTEKYNILDYGTTISNLIYNNTDFKCTHVISNGKLIYCKEEPVFLNKKEIIEDYCSLYKHLYKTDR